MGFGIYWGIYGCAASGGSYSPTPGIAPSGCNLSIALPAGVELPTVADLTMTDGVNTITLRDCIATDYTPQKGSKPGTFTALDRRWRFRFAELTTCWFNQRDANGKLIDEAVNLEVTSNLIGFYGSTPAASIARHLLRITGEYENDTMDILPVDMFSEHDCPEIKYRDENPWVILQDLCRRFGADVYLDPWDNQIKIVKDADLSAFVAALQATKEGDTTQPRGAEPKAIRIVGGPSIHEGEAELVPVYLNASGEVVPLEDSVPISEWLVFVLNSVVDELPDAKMEGESDADAVKRFRKWVFRAYQLPRTVEVGGQQFDRRECLPILGELNSTKRQDGKLTRDAPYVTAERIDPKFFQRMETEEGRIDDGFSIDYKNGVVFFDQPIMKTVGDTFACEPTTVTLRFAFEHSTESYQSDPIPVNPTGLADVEYVRKPEMCERFIDGESQNRAELDAFATKIGAWMREKAQASAIKGSRVEVGLIRVEQPSLNLNVAYEVTAGGAVTRFGMDRAADARSPEYKATLRQSEAVRAAVYAKPERRMAEKEEMRSGKLGAESNPLVLPAKSRLAAPIDGGIRFVNRSGYEIPPFGAIKKDGVDATAGILKGLRPDAASMKHSMIVFNGPAAVPNNKTGVAFNHGEPLATFSGDTPGAGDDMGTQENSFLLVKDNTGFTCTGTKGGLSFVRPFNAGGGLSLTALENGTVETGSGSFSSDYACVRQFDSSGVVTFDREWYVNLDREYKSGEDFALWFKQPELACILSYSSSTANKALQTFIYVYKLTAAVDFGTLSWATKPSGSYLGWPLQVSGVNMNDSAPGTPTLNRSREDFAIYYQNNTATIRALRFFMGTPITQANWSTLYNGGNGIKVDHQYFKRTAASGEYVKAYGGDISAWYGEQ